MKEGGDSSNSVVGMKTSDSNALIMRDRYERSLRDSERSREARESLTTTGSTYNADSLIFKPTTWEDKGLSGVRAVAGRSMSTGKMRIEPAGIPGEKAKPTRTRLVDDVKLSNLDAF